jgi:hypothetical protein
MTYRITAQSYTTTQRITKTVRAANEAEVLRLVSAELEAADFYPISITSEKE